MFYKDHQNGKLLAMFYKDYQKGKLLAKADYITDFLCVSEDKSSLIISTNQATVSRSVSGSQQAIKLQ